MGIKLKKICWDANCFLGILNQEVDKMDACNAIINAAKKGKVELFTSVLTTCEVAKTRTNDIEDYKFDTMIQKYFKQPYIHVVPIEHKVSEITRDLIRKHSKFDRRIKDAVHIATAIYINADVLHTYDSDLLGLSGSESINVEISRPIDFQLPMSLTD